jgi:hypothetical protein
VSALAKLEKKASFGPIGKWHSKNSPLSAQNLFGKKESTAANVVAPAAIAPPTATSSEVTDASRRARIGSALRSSYAKSSKAGETFSGTSYSGNAGMARLLSGV